MIQGNKRFVHHEPSRFSPRHYQLAVAIAAILLIGQLGVAANVAFAADPPTLSVNGEHFQTSHPVRIIEGRALAPIQDFAALTGGTVYFDPSSGLARYVSPTVRFVLISSRSEIMGVEHVQQPITPLVIENGNLLVPVRLMAEVFEWTIGWDSEKRAVLLDNVSVASDTVQQLNLEVEARTPAYVYDPTPEEMDLFLRLITAEAWGEGLQGKLGVAAVVINSILDPYFPNTMYDVITQPGRFSPINDGSINAPILNTSREAAERALQGEDPTLGALYFYNPLIASPAGRAFHETLRFTVQIGNHRFSTRP